MKNTADKLYYKTTFESPIGKITLGSDGANLAGLWTEGQKYFCESVPGELITKDELPVFAETKNWLNRYFNGKKPEISELPLAPSGSEFRQAVWKILMEIPYGTVMTYGEIAKKIAEQRGVKSVSSQAVGGAVGHNPIGIIIPCHRVIGANGNLTGFAGGIEMKQWLLQHEGINMENLFVPQKKQRCK